MTARKTTAPVVAPVVVDARFVAFMATDNQAQAARIMGMGGKPFRDITRGVFGVHVSHDDATDWNKDERLRSFRYAYAVASGDARKSVRDAWKNGDDAPPSAE